MNSQDCSTCSLMNRRSDICILASRILLTSGQRPLLDSLPKCLCSQIYGTSTTCPQDGWPISIRTFGTSTERSFAPLKSHRSLASRTSRSVDTCPLWDARSRFSLFFGTSRLTFSDYCKRQITTLEKSEEILLM
jgi:hypothetical protein